MLVRKNQPANCVPIEEWASDFNLFPSLIPLNGRRRSESEY